MPTGLIVTGVIFLWFAGATASYIDVDGPWAPIIMGGAGLLFFLSGFTLHIIERYKS